MQEPKAGVSENYLLFSYGHSFADFVFQQLCTRTLSTLIDPGFSVISLQILKPAFTILFDRNKKSILLLIRGTHRACLGLLCSTFFSSAPPTLPQSSSTVEFLEQVDLFGTQFSSSSGNMRFLQERSTMPLIDVWCMFCRMQSMCN